MRLLVVTQAVDLDNPVLGFFHRWIEELSEQFDSVIVICLFKGRHTLPENVHVFSLGKEKGRTSPVQYAMRFLLLAARLFNRYDSVFVHMNQEYVLIGGWLWKLLGKRAYLWRNHYQRSALTGIAAFWCTKMFCTSKYSYITKYAKTVLMPIGIDTETFRPISDHVRKNSLLFIARIAPSKRVEVLVEALSILAKKGAIVDTDIFGSATPQDHAYRESMIQRVSELGLDKIVHFHSGVPNAQTPGIYSAHEICVNCSASGMYDKTIFEAAACGSLSVASSRDYAEIAPSELVYKEGDAVDLAEKIEKLLSLSEPERYTIRKASMTIVGEQSIGNLVQRIVQEIK